LCNPSSELKKNRPQDTALKDKQNGIELAFALTKREYKLYIAQISAVNVNTRPSPLVRATMHHWFDCKLLHYVNMFSLTNWIMQWW